MGDLFSLRDPRKKIHLDLTSFWQLQKVLQIRDLMMILLTKEEGKTETVQIAREGETEFKDKFIQRIISFIHLYLYSIKPHVFSVTYCTAKSLQKCASIL